jgi:type I restriction enzyme M protein
MAIKKSELYSSLWKSCDELRGGMDASQYKDYVLVLLFVKYVSDRYGNEPDGNISIPKGEEFGKGGSFRDMVFWKGKKEIGDQINIIIKRLLEANSLQGVIEVPDFNDSTKLGDGKEMVDRLTNLVAIFENESLNFSKNRADGDDILGDAYEYLMRHFATESGKSKGQFYTPAEVSRIMAKVLGISQAERAEQSIYDPTCGSGSLLLKATDETYLDLSIYGQEKDNATAALAKMNMILHNNLTAEIKQGNTLSTPLFTEGGKLKTFDFVVANPPFSDKAWSNGVDAANDAFGRFDGYGAPPDKNGDYAFLLHVVRSLKSKGKGAIILPHGVLFRGNAEAEIRKNLIRRGYIKGIIGLPANLFYGTGIPACIIVIDKENAESRKGIFMLDAAKGFIKDGNKNRLREQDVHKVVDVFTNQTEVAKYSRMVAVQEIENNEYNLNLPRYIDSQETEDIQDIAAHLKGGIPNADIEALKEYWAVYPSLKNTLFMPNTEGGYSQLKVSPENVKTTIFSHPEFLHYAQQLETLFTAWTQHFTPILKDMTATNEGLMRLGTAHIKPKEVIKVLAEDILKRYAEAHLIDQYDVYEHLMNYWQETMQDDVYIIAADDWKAGNEVSRKMKKSKDKKGEEKSKDIDGIDGLEGKLIEPPLIIEKYFLAEKQKIDWYIEQKEMFSAEMEELIEEHGSEDGLLFDVIDEGKINKLKVQKRLKDLEKIEGKTKNPVLKNSDEYNVLKTYAMLVEQDADAKSNITKLQKELEIKVMKQYPLLTIEQIKTYVVTDKWMHRMEQTIKTEMDRISQRLTQRVRELAERYATPLPDLTTNVADLEKKVSVHLLKMGFSI